MTLFSREIVMITRRSFVGAMAAGAALALVPAVATAAPVTTELRNFRVHRQGHTIKARWDVPLFDTGNKLAIVQVSDGETTVLTRVDPDIQRVTLRGAPSGEIQIRATVMDTSQGIYLNTQEFTMQSYQHRIGY